MLSSPRNSCTVLCAWPHRQIDRTIGEAADARRIRASWQAWLIKTTISEQMKRHSVKLIAVAASTFMAHSFLMLLLDFGNATGTAFSGHPRLFIRGPIVRQAFTTGMLLSLFAPVAFAIKWLGRRRQSMPGKCRVSGYDLRATPDRCLECGNVARKVNPSP